MSQAHTSSPVAIVTGASRGIGAAIAQRLAADGHAVVVNYASNLAEAEKVVAAIVERGGRAIAVQADVAHADAARLLFDAATKAFGGVDVLVNNAGAMASELPHLADTSDATFDRLFNINVKGSFLAMREAAKRIRNGGRIINFSTSVIGLGLPGYAVYAATKSAIETMTNILAKELRGRNITVNAVAPGPTATALFLDGKTPARVEQLAKMAPLERLGQPEDIAAMVSVLAGPQGAWVNGQTIRVNGGIV
ncbi:MULTISPECIES: SDR family oxidoreductase [Roseateles]|uniref:3-oxoacyl-[acyl-carrier protein] reductase n=1 Tax=Pelomonas aquatica TaxID=431058 RepID=A0ABU1ZDZ1_9BURK|nr:MULTISPECIES: SDR family oxidoreductase [Roseateles]KQY85574.1 3-ketoacyl-ACP reductase [Pelomonas sp. Root1444]MDR7298839.1 3-oxoacyl-[acyl-carrier protein] reductase [Pelomonas aquatica]